MSLDSSPQVALLSIEPEQGQSTSKIGVASTPAGSSAAEVGWRAILNAGANDFGGISPVTRDYVNPEKPWPHLHALASATAAAGKALVPRYAHVSYPFSFACCDGIGLQHNLQDSVWFFFSSLSCLQSHEANTLYAIA